MAHRVIVTAPSRLHFGLYGFGTTVVRQYGGVGAMVESPGMQLEATANDRFEAVGPLAERLQEFAERWTRFHRRDSLPGCRLEVKQSPPEHAGLGVGTQLGLSVAAALNALYALPPVTPRELAVSVGRGLRSAVGTYGFVQGGLIAERGKLPGESISPLDVRVALPEQWRFVLVRPQVASGLAGPAEAQAFEQLPGVSAESSRQLIFLAREELIPAAIQGDFSRFSSALYRYCNLAGVYFAAVQGGSYNGPVLARFVEIMRSCGAEGVGQSSWGPTLFAALADEASASTFVDRLREAGSDMDFNLCVSRPCNAGAKVVVE